MPSAAHLSSVAEVAGVLKQVHQAFTAYQVARNSFVTSLAGFLDRLDPQNVTLEALMRSDAIAVLCCPLTQDPIPGVQALALTSLSKLAASDPLLSETVVSCGILNSTILSMSHESAPVQAAANAVLASVAHSTPDFAQRVLSAGVLPGIVTQLQLGLPAVKEAAVRTLDSLVCSSQDKAGSICDEHILSILVALLAAPSSPPSLSKAIVRTLGNCASYSQSLSAAVVTAGALPLVCGFVRGEPVAGGPPPDLRAASFNMLSQVARHHEGLAGEVVSSGVVTAAVQALTDKMTPIVRRTAAALLLVVCQKTPELAEAVAMGGVPSCLTRYLQLEKDGDGCLTGVMMAGSMASYHAGVAQALVDAGTSAELLSALRNGDARISGAAGWALEQISAHGEETTVEIVKAGVLDQLVDAYIKAGGDSGALDGTANSEKRMKLKSAIKAVIRSCNVTAPLESLVQKTTPPEVLKHVLRRLDSMLGHDAKGRQQFVTSGALMRLQQVDAGFEDGSALRQLTNAINAAFPLEVVAYYRA